MDATDTEQTGGVATSGTLFVVRFCPSPHRKVLQEECSVPLCLPSCVSELPAVSCLVSTYTSAVWK